MEKTTFSNVQIWDLAERGVLPVNTIITDQEGNEFIFTGKSFQLLSDKKEDKYYGFCVGDRWEITGQLE